MMFNVTLRCFLIATFLVLVAQRATAQTYRLTLEPTETEVLIGMPVFLTATLTNISRMDQTQYRRIENLQIVIRADNEDAYKLYEAGVYPKRRIKPRLRTIKPGESWEFREIVLYQYRYEPYVPNPVRNESGLRLKDPGRYWMVAKYPQVGGGWIESEPIAIDVSAPTRRLDRQVLDVLTCRDRESQRQNLNEDDRLQCMNRHIYLMHTSADPRDPSVRNGGHAKRFVEFRERLWQLLEQGAGASRYGPGIKWALSQRGIESREHGKDHPLTKEKDQLLENAPVFRRGASK